MRILLVDDCIAVVESLGELLSMHHTVDITDDPKHALSLSKLTDYDLLVTDYEMPGINGITLAKKMREASSSRLRVIAMTGSIETAALHASSHIDRVLSKPFSCAVLRQAIADLGCVPTN